MFYGKNEVKSLSVSLYFEWTAIFFRLEIKVSRIFLHFFGCSILSYQWLNGYEEKYLFSFARIMIYFPPQQSVIFEHSFYCRIFFEYFYFLFMRVRLKQFWKYFIDWDLSDSSCLILQLNHESQNWDFNLFSYISAHTDGIRFILISLHFLSQGRALWYSVNFNSEFLFLSQRYESKFVKMGF